MIVSQSILRASRTKKKLGSHVEMILLFCSHILNECDRAVTTLGPDVNMNHVFVCHMKTLNKV